MNVNDDVDGHYHHCYLMQLSDRCYYLDDASDGAYPTETALTRLIARGTSVDYLFLAFLFLS